jgi:hypothetical protein
MQSTGRSVRRRLDVRSLRPAPEGDCEQAEMRYAEEPARNAISRSDPAWRGKSSVARALRGGEVRAFALEMTAMLAPPSAIGGPAGVLAGRGLQ